ncbi:MAG: hypothetical protein ACTSQB_05010 [Candidatus Heimdallarchaeota archaeon]
MQQNDASLSKSTSSTDKICVICNKVITENDLVSIVNDGEISFSAHFRCYVEIQEKICSECGVPFKDQENLLFCDEHREYFHSTETCLKKHIEKHLRFKQCMYDVAKNRITMQETTVSNTIF